MKAEKHRRRDGKKRTSEEDIKVSSVARGTLLYHKIKEGKHIG